MTAALGVLIGFFVGFFVGGFAAAVSLYRHVERAQKHLSLAKKHLAHAQQENDNAIAFYNASKETHAQAEEKYAAAEAALDGAIKERLAAEEILAKARELTDAHCTSRSHKPST